jgi:hypothetical protein
MGIPLDDDEFIVGAGQADLQLPLCIKKHTPEIVFRGVSIL